MLGYIGCKPRFGVRFFSVEKTSYSLFVDEWRRLIERRAAFISLSNSDGKGRA
jgi:hypothetical protein